MGKGHGINGMILSHSVAIACILLFMVFSCYVKWFVETMGWKPRWPMLTIGIQFNGLCIKNVIGQGCVVARVL